MTMTMTTMMTVKVDVDRAEALRRGHATSSSTLDLALGDMSAEQRLMIAARLTQAGALASRGLNSYYTYRSSTGWCQCAECPVRAAEVGLLVVPEPTLAGVIEAIAAEEAAIEAYAAAQREAKAQKMAERRERTLHVLEHRQTTKRLERWYCTGEPGDEQYSESHRCEAGEGNASYQWPFWPGDPDLSVIASSEAQAWIAECEADRAASVARAKAEALEALRAKRAVAAEAEVKRDRLRTWALEHGDDLLRARIAHESEGVVWTALARKQWTDRTLAPLDTAKAEPEGMSVVEIEGRKTPTVAELEALDGVRAWLVEAALDATASLEWVTLAEEQTADEYEHGEALVHQCVLRITLTCLDDSKQTRNYAPAAVQAALAT